MKTFVGEIIQCRTFLRVLYRVRNARSASYTQSVMLSPRFIPESAFYTQSVVRSPQSVFYTDRVLDRFTHVSEVGLASLRSFVNFWIAVGW